MSTPFRGIPLAKGGGRQGMFWHSGHSIRLVVFRIGWSKYLWRYQIDDGPVVECKDGAVRLVRMARDEALAEATRTIDRIAQSSHAGSVEAATAPPSRC